ncbi:hypothetical protein E4U21_004070 [Claviceps maximensis]|nr:hypothetical protein E4U21_004070 [Claviceps maximensis]
MVNVFKWLDEVITSTEEVSCCPDLPISHQRPRKRPRPLSPDPSSMDQRSTLTKRRRQDDADRTSVATFLNPLSRPPRTLSSPSKSSASASIWSKPPSSPRRKFSIWRISDEGITIRQLGGLETQGLPPAIRMALLRIREINRCHGILSARSDASKFEAFISDNGLDVNVFAKSETDGSRLTPKEACDIANNARRCFEENHDEDNWICDVHCELSRKVFRTSSPNTSENLVDFARFTRASIIREYLPRLAPDRPIDMCMYINPGGEPEYEIKIDRLRQTLPEFSINHSTYLATLGCPTSCNVEIKRSGNDFDGGVLQIGVWQAAQWKMLRFLLEITARRRFSVTSTMAGQDDVFDDDDEAMQYEQKSLEKLGALPGIYSQGHEWYYVATSPEFRDKLGQPSLRTILWLEARIGSTDNELGVHRIAAFLEYIRNWSASTYWPWFKECILD